MVKLSTESLARSETRDPATAHGAGKHLVHKHPPMHWWIQAGLNGLVVNNSYQRMLASTGTDFSFAKSAAQHCVGFLISRFMGLH